jgi:hypothetical protein
MAGTLIVNLALIFYTIGIVSEQRSHRITQRVLIFLTAGVAFDIIATACPYCIRILDEAIRTLGAADRLVVRDIAELLLQSVELKVAADKQPHENLELDQEACHV